ncbi:MAG TPA: PspC domain-containing protein [Steroidobacteraceae bacterium]|nr:PspC domain-containing protein [Steroidobacteraceae bacterium]
MQKVVSISLNGNSYQLEEPGYDQLRAYLERAEARLKDSPDRTEVMNDLEQAISEKCRATLGPHKSVVNTLEIERIISEMGPVEAADGQPADAAAGAATNVPPPAAGAPPRKRLFKIREGAMWGGVCNGLAAYMGLDVTWVRIGTVVITIFTGVTIFIYLAMLIIVPYADTAEDRAAAFGVPFNTEDILNRAKKNFDDTNQRWHREWRRQQRHWNRQFRQMNEQLRMTAQNVAPNLSPAARGIMSVFLPIAAIVGAVVFVVWIYALISLVTQHSIFGWGLPHGIPLWVGIVGLCILYGMVSAPIKAVRNGGHEAAGYHPGWRALHSVIWIACVALLLWAAYWFLPGVRELVDNLMWAANLTATTISETIV